MTITTQDGRKLEIDRKYHLHISGSIHESGKLNGKKCKLGVATFTKVIKQFSDGTTYETGGNIVERYGVIGEFDTETGFYKARDALKAAWEDGTTKFNVPIDTGEVDEAEALKNFCQKYGLTLASINELGYKPADVAKNLRIYSETDEFERRGILVCDPETHDYDKSLARWQALQQKAKVVSIKPKDYAKRGALRRKFMGR